jgi:hypothetical protein
MDHENTIRRFCDAMNDHDADAVAALVDPSIVIQIGPNQASSSVRTASSRALR